MHFTWLAGLAVSLSLVISDRKSLRRENNDFRNTTLYAERNTCPNFLGGGQAVLESDRVPSSSQPNIFEELTVPEMAAVRPPRSTAVCRFSGRRFICGHLLAAHDIPAMQIALPCKVR